MTNKMTYCVSLVTKRYEGDRYYIDLTSGLIKATSAAEALGKAVMMAENEIVMLTNVVSCDPDIGAPFEI